MNLTAAGHRRACITAAGAAAAIMLLAGCHLPGISSAAGSSGPSIIVASVPGIGDAPLYVAEQEGLFRQAGLTVRIRSYSSMAAEVTAIRDGNADVAAGDYGNFFFAQERYPRMPMVVVADGYDAGPNVAEVMVGPHSGITSPQDLAGKTIGTAAPQLIPDTGDGQPYSLDTVAAASVLNNDGIQPTAVTLKPLPVPDLVGSLRQHTVDAILVTEPQIYQAESELGAHSLLDAYSGNTVNLPLEGYFASASFASKHRDALRGFRSVLRRAQAAAGHRASVQAALSRYDGLSHTAAAMITLGLYPTSLDVSSLQRVASLMSFYGALPRPLNVKRMIFS